MNNLYFLPSGTVDEFNVVIEIPYGSQNKYELDPQTGAVFLDRVLYSSEFYPFNYGFIPSTKVADGDALDVAVLLTNPVPPMTVIQCRAIGILRKVDGGDQDNCIIGVPTKDPRFDDVKSLEDLPKHKLDEIADFFANYKRLQNKKSVVEGYFGIEDARQEVGDALNNYPEYKK
ncbi:inorganic diphosphatase [Candidatus Gracilibacteria bacterium]|nr:inorganic diphosphatase [Candidatus Gracilibacteria bacterium]NJS40872.1 inorganic diphosphatase [Candidatus Gracilibacteria bacterium]